MAFLKAVSFAGRRINGQTITGVILALIAAIIALMISTQTSNPNRLVTIQSIRRDIFCRRKGDLTLALSFKKVAVMTFVAYS